MAFGTLAKARRQPALVGEVAMQVKPPAAIENQRRTSGNVGGAPVAATIRLASRRSTSSVGD
jgi:hypothetical protein